MGQSYIILSWFPFFPHSNEKACAIQALYNSYTKIVFDTRVRKWFYPCVGFSPSLRSVANVPTRINNTLCNKGGKLTFSSEDDDWARVIHECSQSSSESEKVNCSLVTHRNFFNKCRNRTSFCMKSEWGIVYIDSSQRETKYFSSRCCERPR